MGFVVFSKEPRSLDARRFLGGAIGKAGTAPKYILTDKGRQFCCSGFRDWCEHKGIDPRYASTGRQIAATAIIERFFRTLKEEWLRRIMVPFRRDAMRHELSLYACWFAQFRPHEELGGRTPNEIYDGKKAANEKPRVEPRRKWPRGSPCARPLVKAKTGRSSPLALAVRFHADRRQLPIVELKQAA